jgi:putative hemolysin
MLTSWACRMDGGSWRHVHAGSGTQTSVCALPDCRLWLLVSRHSQCLCCTRLQTLLVSRHSQCLCCTSLQTLTANVATQTFSVCVVPACRHWLLFLQRFWRRGIPRLWTVFETPHPPLISRRPWRNKNKSTCNYCPAVFYCNNLNTAKRPPSAIERKFILRSLSLCNFLDLYDAVWSRVHPRDPFSFDTS